MPRCGAYCCSWREEIEKASRGEANGLFEKHPCAALLDTASPSKLFVFVEVDHIAGLAFGDVGVMQNTNPFQFV